MNQDVKKKFKIEGMHCTACAMNIDFDLEDLDGVKSSNTSYAKQLLEVTYNPEKIKPKDILKAVKKTGYSAKELEPKN